MERKWRKNGVREDAKLAYKIYAIGKRKQINNYTPEQ